MSNQLTPEQILWLKSMNITNYEFDSNRGLVNVDGDINISYRNLTSIPVQFGYVGGDFDCHYNKLTTLQGAPREVGGNFNCHYNNFEAEPDHSFIDIGGSFDWK